MNLPEHCLIRLVASGEHGEDQRQAAVERLTTTLRFGLPPIFEGRLPKNESEVQKATNGIIKASSQDWMREMPLLPFAGIGTKPDFARLGSKAQGWIFVEMKYPSNRVRLNGVVTEITSRIAIYRTQNACPLFVVYDPARTITDDNKFVQDCAVGQDAWIAIIR
jgi:hypothetical protein